MKKMYVCGDSWLSPSVETPGQHMAEIVADRLGYEMVPLSRGAMSNGGICIQIDTAIDLKADFILVNTTNHDRIEIAIAHANGHQFRTSDILYGDQSSSDQSSSSLLPFNGSSPNLLINNIGSLIDRPILNDYPEKRKAVLGYFNEIYMSEWKLRVDRWCMYAMLHKLHLSKIPYLVVLDFLGVVHECSFIDVNSTLTIASDFVVPACIERAKVSDFRDPGYHTLPEAQQQAADHILKYLAANPRIFSSRGPGHSTSQP